MNHITHCSLRLGDNLAALHFIRKCALKYPAHHFTHYALDPYIAQLEPVVAGLPNVKLAPLEKVSAEAPTHWQRVPEVPSVNLWKNADGWWDRHPLKLLYGPVMISFFHYAAEQMGIESPLLVPRDLLFDYPALLPKAPPCAPFDFLIVNSQPQSGQFPNYNNLEFEGLIAMLARRYHVITTQPCGVKVTCTWDHNLDVTEIGQLSQFCKAIIMVSTGPSWPTFNVWNLESVTLRVIIHGAETVDLAPHTIHTNKISAVRDILMANGYL